MIGRLAAPTTDAVLGSSTIRLARRQRTLDTRSRRVDRYGSPGLLDRDRGDRGDRMTGLLDIRTRIAAAAEKAGRDPSTISLIAVSKIQPDDRVDAFGRGDLTHLVREVYPGGAPIDELHLEVPSSSIVFGVSSQPNGTTISH